MNSGESPAEDQDEELRRKAEAWLVSMCESGRASYDSDPQRIADYLQKEGNEKHKLGIKIDMGFIKEQLRISDDEIKEQSKVRRQNSPPSSSSSSTPPRVLFIRRELQRTDTRDHQNRLSMPCSQVNEEVLTAGEKAEMEAGEKVLVELIDPHGRRYDVNLKLTSAGKTSYSYAIGKPWNEIRRENGFRAGMVMNIWGFRGERGQLCFQLET